MWDFALSNSAIVLFLSGVVSMEIIEGITFGMTYFFKGKSVVSLYFFMGSD